MRLTDPLFPSATANPDLTDKVLGVVYGEAKTITLQQIKDVAGGGDIVDALNSTSTTSVLSANQVKV